MWWKKEPSRRTFKNQKGWTQQVKSKDLFEDIPETKVEENSIEDDQQELIQRLRKSFTKGNQRNSKCDQNKRDKERSQFILIQNQSWGESYGKWSARIDQRLKYLKIKTENIEKHIENDQQELIKD